MDKQRILKEAQKIASKFSFWMVSGDIAHLYGYVYEKSDNKYELEIKFDENFPDSPPNFIYHTAIKNLLGDIQLNKMIMWTPRSTVVDIIQELCLKIQDTLKQRAIVHQPIHVFEENNEHIISEEYITPDLNAYPPDFEYDTKSNLCNDFFNKAPTEFVSPISEEHLNKNLEISPKERIEEILVDPKSISIEINTELGLIQQYYSYDQKGNHPADINIYITITIAKTFNIGINFSEYPNKPILTLPNQFKNILGDPYKTLTTLKKWNIKKPPHIVDVLQELEKKLFFISDIETEMKKILNEYKCDKIESSISKLKVHLVTYGFKEYLLDIDLIPHPKTPNLSLSSELQDIIQTPITSLNAYKNWIEKESESIEIIREIAWLIDKNSRINFEIALLKEHYKDLKYDPTRQTLDLNMKGKMKTQDLIFKFQIDLPNDYPMKMPDIKVLNEFEIEAHEKIKSDLQASFRDFFKEWSPYSYLVDLFNLISEKIFEVSVVACVICHRIECPSCSIKIAGQGESCHIECPHCERAYHKHCWEQTILSFGKCGFCLKPPPPEMIP